MTFPTLTTERLTLRPFAPADAPAVQLLAGNREVASTTLTVPHPYEDGVAEAWIETHATAWEARTGLTLAVAHGSEGLVGAIGLSLELPHRRAEIGYWIGVPYWNCGYASEAAKRLIDYGFDSLDLNRIEGQYLMRNPASGRVLARAGMRLEGVRRQYIVKWDVPEDVAICAVLAEERTPAPLPG